MGKFIFWAAVTGAAVWAYYNVDFEQFKPNAINTFSQEKTINKVNQARENKYNQEQSVLEGNF